MNASVSAISSTIATIPATASASSRTGSRGLTAARRGSSLGQMIASAAPISSVNARPSVPSYARVGS